MAGISGMTKHLVSDKGFGFVLAGDGTEYFFHQSACADTRFDDPREEQTVTFKKRQGPRAKGRRAARRAYQGGLTSSPHYPGSFR
jgi:cold shock CspA family protein